MNGPVVFMGNGTSVYLSHAGTECVEQIQIVITSTQKADNVIPDQVR